MAEVVHQLTISPEKVCYIIVKAREFDAKVQPVNPNSASNPADDGDREILEDLRDDPTSAELAAAISSLNVDESIELVALAWLGRGDFAAAEWLEATAMARERHSNHTAAYLASMPTLGDFLEEGLSQLGYSCAEYETGRL